jgi:hypothetical protein
MLGPMKFDTADLELAWAIGIFEGEGSFIVGGDKRYPCLQLKLGMTDEDVIRKASAILGLKVTGPYYAKFAHHKPMWRATKGGPEARETLLKILPYLGARRQARAAEVLAKTDKGAKT